MTEEQKGTGAEVGGGGTGRGRKRSPGASGFLGELRSKASAQSLAEAEARGASAGRAVGEGGRVN